MESQISIKFNNLVDAWIHLKKIDLDWNEGLACSAELFDCEWYQHECENDLLREIRLEIVRDELEEGEGPINPFDF